VLKPEYVLQIGDLSQGGTLLRESGHPLVESEDVVPLGICALAVRRYLSEICEAAPEVVERVTSDAIQAQAAPTEGVFSAIARCLTALAPELHIEKVGFARAVVETVAALAARVDDADAQALLAAFETNMKALFRRLRRMQRDAERELTADRVSARVNRAKNAFLQDRADSARREHAVVLFEEIERALDNSAEADAIRLELQALRRDFKIDEDPAQAIEDYRQFRERLEQMRYVARLSTQSPTLQEVTASQAEAGTSGVAHSKPVPVPPVAPPDAADATVKRNVVEVTT
jgi:hypothetical protein